MSNCVVDACTRRSSLYFPEPVCPRHRTAEQRDLVVELDRRGAAVGVKGGDWPYGPNIYVDNRLALVGWAEATGYRLATPNARCLHWLVGKARHCSARRDSFDHDGRIERDGDTLDHPTFWTKGGKPALLLAQPYRPPAADWVERTVATWPVAVDVAHPAPWYGVGTYGVLITPAVSPPGSPVTPHHPQGRPA
jgi:hypothetical protein